MRIFISFFLAICVLASCTNTPQKKDITSAKPVVLTTSVNDKKVKEIKKVQKIYLYKDVYNAETGHWMSYPKSYMVINDTYGDTLHLISKDGLVSIRKWNDLNSLPISFFDKDGDGDADSLIDMNVVVRQFKFSIEKYISQFEANDVEIVSTSDYMDQFTIVNEDIIKETRVLLCDVVGGTKIPVFLEITYDNAYRNKDEINHVISSFESKFITSKK